MKMGLKSERLLPLNLQFFAEGDGDGSNGGDNGTAGENPAGGTPAGAAGGEQGTGGTQPEETVESLKAKLAAYEAKAAKDKAAVDKATHEAAEAKKALKAKMTQEEIDAAAKKEAEEKRDQEFAEMQKELARSRSTKGVMAKLGVDEETAGNIAECLMGCEDLDNALLLIQKAWEAREAKLRAEFGKVPGPGAGGGNEDRETQEALKLAKEIGQQRAGSNSSIRTQLQGFIRRG